MLEYIGIWHWTVKREFSELCLGGLLGIAMTLESKLWQKRILGFRFGPGFLQ